MSSGASAQRRLFQARLSVTSARDKRLWVAVERVATNALALAAGVDPGRPGTANWRRLWHESGIELGSVTVTALVLNLELAGSAPAVGAAHAASLTNEPAVLTLRSMSGALEYRGDLLYVCENPAIIELAGELEAPCPPLVCTYGWWNTAVEELLAAAQVAGAELRAHADFDRDGIAIVNALYHRFGAKPWRMGTGEYLAAIDSIIIERELGDEPAEAAWDNALKRSMMRQGLRVEEEAVAGGLLLDLSRRR
jgi:uncharacterized protein (TIGR02679 family)